jgi:hypothetical protein
VAYDKAESPSTALPGEIQREKEMVSEHISQQTIPMTGQKSLLLPNRWGPVRGCKTGSLDRSTTFRKYKGWRMTAAIFVM